jgi:hypothetical protein
LAGTALVIGVIIFFLGWYVGAVNNGEGDERFESCRFDGEILQLRWLYGPGDTVSPKVEQHGGEIVVSLDIDKGDNSPDEELVGHARLGIDGDQDTVRYPDGTELDCPRSAATDD